MHAHTGLGKNCFSFSALGEAGKVTAATKEKVEKVNKNEQLQVKTKEETEKTKRERARHTEVKKKYSF